MSEVKRFTLVSSKHFGCAVVEDKNGVYTLHSDYAELKAQRDALAAENAALKSAISYVCDTDNLPDYQYDGMGCGIEDRGIADRYEAARYGWDEAMERIYSEVISFTEDTETPATDAYLNSVRADAIESVVDALTSSGALTVGDSIVEVVKLAESIRAGEQS